MIKCNIFTGAVLGAALTALTATAGLAQQAPGGDRLIDVIVVMNEATAPGGHGANQANAAAFARGLGINPRHSYGTALFGFSASVPEAVMNALENNPRVDYVEIDRIAFASAPPWCGVNDPHPACKGDGGGEDPAPLPGQVVPWGITRTGAVANSNDGTYLDGNNDVVPVNVYVLDTGIDIGHPDLIVNDRVDCTGNGPCVVDPGEADDKNGHGTHVAGTIAAQDNDIGVLGMAPGVNLHAVKVLGNSGRGSFSGIIAGIDWVATQNRPSVINMSLGGGGSKDGTCSNGVYGGGSDAFYESICKATNAGVVVVVAAGNSSANAAGSVPAAYDDTVITVSATNNNDDWPSFSNWGNADSGGWTSNVSAPVAIAAPGAGILSTWKGGGTNTISGTSMASPHVAGAVALWLGSNSFDADPMPTVGFAAFTNARAALLTAAEETDEMVDPDTAFVNTSGDSHTEDFLDVRSFDQIP